VKFIDAITIPSSGCRHSGIQFVSECGGWRVTASSMENPAEWLVWSRSPVDGSAVRRMPWARFAAKEQAAAAAALCEVVTMSGPGRAVTSAQSAMARLRDGVADRLRSVGTLGIFAGMRLAHATAEAVRDFARRQSAAE
jgi:hypothetical protein